jgi:hypothetical protein
MAFESSHAAGMVALVKRLSVLRKQQARKRK